MNIAQNNIGRLSFAKRIPLLFMVMTFSAIAPLYFENVRQIFGLVFLAILLFLSIVSYRNSLCKLTLFEKRWLYVAISYALILILSYFLRFPYTQDGEWRNAAPIFVLLISAWYFLSIRFNQSKELIKYVALSSLICALALLITELYMADSLVGYRFGEVYDGTRGLAAVGFLLPLTTGLLAVIWLKKRSHFYLILLLIAFVLSGLNGSNTAFSIVLLSILFGMIFVFIWGANLTSKTKMLSILFLVGMVLSSVWLSKSKIITAANDVVGITYGDYSTSTGLRYAMFNIGIEALDGNWLLGVGPSQYKNQVISAANHTDYPESVKNFSSSVMQLHNQYIMSFLLAGVAGGISLLFLLMYPIRVFLSYFKQTKDPAAFIMSGMMVGVMFVMFFGAMFTYTYTTIFYMLAISALISRFSKTEGATN